MGLRYRKSLAMNITYIHITPDLFNNNLITPSDYVYSSIPEYFYNSFKTLRKNYSGVVNCIAPKASNTIAKQNIDNNNVNFIDAEQLFENAIFKEIINETKAKFPTHFYDSFWLTTFMRLPLLFTYIQDNKLEDTIHLEHDNIIFYDPSAVIKAYKKLDSVLYYPQVGPHIASAGILFAKNNKASDLFLRLISKLINKGEVATAEYAGQYPRVSEMVMLDILQRYDKSIYQLPILPDEKYNDFKYLFDGASWGQYAFGTNNGHPKEYAEHNHYIGEQLLLKNVSFEFKERKPIVIKDNKEYKLFNLHVHNKKIFNDII